MDACVADVFGFHALQVGLPELDALRTNRMPHRWLATSESVSAMDSARNDEVPRANKSSDKPRAIALLCDFDALPFDSASLDLVVLAHSLELARDPHQALREVERVLMPEGRVVVLGFNPSSLWALRQRLGRLIRGLGVRRGKPHFMPSDNELIGYWRLRDWMRLLSFELESGHFGCYKLPLASNKWLSRFGWMERVGDRWWPVLGAAYMLVAVKRIRGMRLVGMARGLPAKAKNAPAVARSHRSNKTLQTHDID